MTLLLPRSRPDRPAHHSALDLPLDPRAADLLAARQRPADLLAGLLAVVLDRYGSAWTILGHEQGRAVRYEARPAALDGTFAEVPLRPAPAGGAATDGDRPCAAVLPPGTRGLPAALHAVVWAVTPHDGSLTVHYDDTILGAPTARRMAEHLRLLLDTAAAEPTARTAAFPLLLPDERRQLAEWNPQPAPRPTDTLHALFRAQAARTPEHPALVMGARTLTYRQLDEASDHLARRLRPAVAEPGDLMVVSGERSTELFTAVLAVLKAGAGYVHLDPALPTARAEAMLRLTRPAATLRTTTGHPLTDHADALRVEEALSESDGTPQPPDPLTEIAHDGSTAYVIFTSGSTGEPKAVLRPHRMHTARIHLEQRLYGMGADDRHLLKSAISFREFLWPLASGGTAVIAEPGRDRDDRYLAELIDRERLTTVSFVPSMLRLLLAQPAFRRAAALRHVFVGGEPLGTDLEERVRALGRELHNTYTLSEADYVCHRQGPRGARPEHGDAATVIGRPLDMHVYLCDRHGHPVPPGAVGEILTGGPGLADGYLGRPELTAERFVANTLDPQGPARLFRTGDLARHRADGQLEYLGRADAQVKVRGQRVEPAEVELILRTHPEVADAAVAGVADADQGALLAAYVVPGAAEPSVGALRTFVADRLPDFMVPSYFAVVPALPLLDSGKVDRARLQVPSRARPPLDVPFARPSTPGQHTAARLFAQVLGLDEAGLDDDFFQLGGDSLRLMLLRSAVEADTGTEIDLADLLRAATPRALAALVRDRSEPAAGTETQHAPADTRRLRAARLRQQAARTRHRAVPGTPGAQEESR